VRTPDAPRRRQAAAFTLVELLVVVAIILILLSLLAPSFSTLRARAETAHCLSQLRQVMAAANTYAAEKLGEWPNPWEWVKSESGSGGAWVEWSQPDTAPRGVLYPYLARNDAVFVCPAFRRSYGANPAVAHLTPYVTYSMNEYLTTAGKGGSWRSRLKVRRSQIARPAGFAVFGDEGTVKHPWASTVINNLLLGVGDIAKTNETVDGLAAFHNAPYGNPTAGMGNAAFADGHVATMHPSRTKEIFTPDCYK